MSVVDLATCEGVAAAMLAPIGLDVIDPRHLAVAYELELVPVAERSGTSACSRGMLIRYPILAPPQRQSGVIAHELGHVALRQCGEDWRDERAAARVGAALLAPRRPLLAALRAHGPDLDTLAPIFEHASAELLARRIAEVSEVSCTIAYASPRGWKVKRHSPLVPEASTSPRLSPDEERLVESAREHGYAEANGARAWWIAWPRYEHAIVIS